MKISREEFKELVAEYQEYWDRYTEGTKYINEDFLDSMPTGYELIEKWIGLKEIGLVDIVSENNEIAFVAYYENGAVKFTNDLDLIYDIYVKEKEEA